MRTCRMTVLVGVLLIGIGGGRAARHLVAGEQSASVPPPGAAGAVILNEGSLWRMFASWNRPMVRAGTELKECAVPRFADLTAPPPAEWAQPDFADGQWSRWRAGRSRFEGYRYGMGAYGAPSPTLSLFCLRGRFAVEDPANRAQVCTLADGQERKILVDTIRGNWKAYYQNIADVLNKGAELAVKPEQVYRAMRVYDAAMRSAETGQVVTMA